MGSLLDKVSAQGTVAVLACPQGQKPLCERPRDCEEAPPCGGLRKSASFGSQEGVTTEDKTGATTQILHQLTVSRWGPSSQHPELAQDT